MGAARLLAMLAITAILGSVALHAVPAMAADEPAQSLPSVAPPTPWLPLPAATSTLTRIGFGSCLHQRQPQPIWTAIIATSPQLFLMIGDNVYGDSKGDDVNPLVAAYRTQGRHPELAAARAAMPFLATWDDHDYGLNNAASGFRHARAATALFYDFWQVKRHHAAGVHAAHSFGPPGRRVQIILLDTRTFRSEFRAKTRTFPYRGSYEPDHDPAKTMLGHEQWAWLEAELRRPADVRLLVSSIQVLADGHGHERWGNLPAERDRLLALIERTGASGTILLSGDRHIGAIYEMTAGNGRKLVEMTSSSLNRSYGPSRDARLPPLVSEPFHPENFGLVDVDWQAGSVLLSLNDIAGARVSALRLSFAQLGIGQ
jgi:alkaline phosphatase D